MRKYALVIFDDFDKIIDRFNLDFITEPTNNGYKLKLDVISGDVEDIITRLVQEKLTIKFNVNQVGNSYQRANVMVSWIQKYSPTQYKMALEYDEGELIRYCEGRVTSLTKGEKDEFKDLVQSFEFQQITPYFLRKENNIVIKASNIGKKYPYKYPYNYGSQIVENNLIDNEYIYEIPLIITIDGAIDNPTIDLLDENGNIYSKVKFNDINIAKGEKLFINSAQKRIYKIFANGTMEDYIPNVSPQYDTFLRAKTGTTIISINIDDIAEGFKLTGGWRQYIL